MFESKYSKVLTVMLVIVILAIIGLIGFLAYDYYQKYVVTKETSEFVDNFQGDVVEEDKTATENNENDLNTTDAFNQIKDADTTGTNGSPVKQTYKGFGVLGTMEIPATNFKYPVLEKVTKKSIIEMVYSFLIIRN